MCCVHSIKQWKEKWKTWDQQHLGSHSTKAMQALLSRFRLVQSLGPCVDACTSEGIIQSKAVTWGRARLSMSNTQLCHTQNTIQSHSAGYRFCFLFPRPSLCASCTFVNENYQKLEANMRHTTWLWDKGRKRCSAFKRLGSCFFSRRSRRLWTRCIWWPGKKVQDAKMIGEKDANYQTIEIISTWSKSNWNLRKLLVKSVQVYPNALQYLPGLILPLCPGKLIEVSPTHWPVLLTSSHVTVWVSFLCSIHAEFSPANAPWHCSMDNNNHLMDPHEHSHLHSG